MKISFLIHSVYGVGGTIRGTLNLAGELADRHDVDIVSVFQHREKAAFAIDPRIRLVPLVDTRPGSEHRETDHPLHRLPSEDVPRGEARYRQYSRLTDARVRDHYAASDADVVVGTRPGLTAYVARFADPGAVRVGQENMTHNHHSRALRTDMARHIGGLDAFVTVSARDADVYRAHLPPSPTRVLHIPNSVPAPQIAPSDGSGRTVVAAGRLAAVKQYERLIEAFAEVVSQRPDWQLRIYGGGEQRGRLRHRIERLGLYNHVHLMGPRAPLDPEWVKASIAVSTSRHESFGMTLVEAMRCGLPVVSTDCDYGPREILRDGTDGLLVPVGDTGAVAKALLRLIEDEELRRRMGTEARKAAERFAPHHIARQYEDLFGELAAAKARLTRATTAPRPATRSEPSPAAPTADCATAVNGDLTVRLRAPWQERVSADGTRLICALRGRTRPAKEHVFPVGPDGVATIPAHRKLGEGVWDVYLGDADRRLPVLSGTVDQRGTLRPDHGEDRGVRNLVPHPDADSAGLTLHSWSRPAHAEVTHVHVARGEFRLTGTLHGTTGFGMPPELLLTLRADRTRQLIFPGEQFGPTGFRFTVPARLPATHRHDPRDVWDLLVRHAPGAPPARAGRFLDDIVEKKHVCAYPEVLLPAGGRHRAGDLLKRVFLGRPLRKVQVRVFHAQRNDLALRVADRSPADRKRRFTVRIVLAGLKRRARASVHGLPGRP